MGLQSEDGFGVTRPLSSHMVAAPSKTEDPGPRENTRPRFMRSRPALKFLGRDELRLKDRCGGQWRVRAGRDRRRLEGMRAN